MTRTLLLCLAFAGSALADNTWRTPATVKIIRQQASGQCFFKVNEAPVNTRWYVFDATTATGRNFLSILISAKTSGMQFQFYETTPVAGQTNTWNADNITLGLDI